MTITNALYVFQADTYCQTCAEEIRRMTNASLDSGEYPQGPYYDQESDTPTHCGKCHAFLEQPLTQEGYRYVQETLADKRPSLLSETEKMWVDFYSFSFHENEWSHPTEWLDQHISFLICQLREQLAHDSQNLISLDQIAREIASKLDGDQIQDLFQSDMEDDGYFKETGWYSPEMENE